jgi:predicted kinase
LKPPVLIIVSGPPCTGKTSLGVAIAGRFGLPFISKDGIKEPLGEVLGAGDRAWSRKLGLASYSLLYHFCETLLKVGVSHVIESNFTPENATERFREMKAKYGFEPLQVQCMTDGVVLVDRFKQRAASGERHPVHLDRQMYGELEKTLARGRYDKIEIGGAVYWVDTTDFSRINYERLFAALESAMQGREAAPPVEESI